MANKLSLTPDSQINSNLDSAVSSRGDESAQAQETQVKVSKVAAEAVPPPALGPAGRQPVRPAQQPLAGRAKLALMKPMQLSPAATSKGNSSLTPSSIESTPASSPSSILNTIQKKSEQLRAQSVPPPQALPEDDMEIDKNPLPAVAPSPSPEESHPYGNSGGLVPSRAQSVPPPVSEPDGTFHLVPVEPELFGGLEEASQAANEEDELSAEQRIAKWQQEAAQQAAKKKPPQEE
ncbi:MAG: hypothetical protein HY861_04520 [Chlamydiia bacterium]|nr:hypothetical protein [Chlamydiia bacterium]